MSVEFQNDNERMEMIGEFLTESSEHLQLLNENLLAAEEVIKTGGNLSDEQMNTMFRAAHTIKGVSSFIGLTNINQLTHEMETLLDKVRNGTMSLKQNIIDVVFAAIDNLQVLMENLKTSGQDAGDINASLDGIKAIIAGDSVVVTPSPAIPEANVVEIASVDNVEPITVVSPPTAPAEEVIDTTPPHKAMDIPIEYLSQFLTDMDELVSRLDELLVVIEATPGDRDLINETYRVIHTIKGTAGMMGRSDIETTAHAVEDLLSIIRTTGIHPDENVMNVMFAGIDFFKFSLSKMKTDNFVIYNVSELNQKIKNQLEDFKSVHKDAIAAAAVIKPVVVKLNLSTEEISGVKTLLASGGEVWKIIFYIEEKVTLKGIKALLIEERLRKLGGLVVKCDPPLGLIKDNQKNILVIKVLYASKISGTIMRKELLIDEVKVATIVKEDNDIVTSILASAEFGTPASKPVEEVKMKPEPKSPEPIPPVTKSVAPTPVEVKQPEAQPPVHATPEITNVPKPSPPEHTGDKKEPAKSSDDSTLRIDVKKLDVLMNLAGELVTCRARYAQMVKDLNKIMLGQHEKNKILNDFNAQLAKLGDGINASSDVVSRDKNNKILEQLKVQQHKISVALQQNSLYTIIHDLDDLTNTLGKNSSDIQNGVMQTRMIPIEGLFSRFKRIVRDIGKEVGKDVVLKLVGEDTELDKKIIDSLADPLTHMIRNAVDHGLETGADRLKAGKSETGVVTLKASHAGNSISIEISDDGKGIDAGAIAQSAYKKGLITEDQITSMSDKEKLDLIFLPGFSTAIKVTALSGRGVGMDVVRTMIDSVNGNVTINSVVGAGTTFVLRIPLTLAIIQALLVKINNEPYAFPLDSVTEIIKCTASEIYSIDGNDTVKLRNHVLSVVELEKIIGLKGGVRPTDADRKIVVIKDSDQQIGIVVDTLIGEEEIVIKSLTDHFAEVKGIAGASILGDGNIALILDPAAIVKNTR